jgi:opacity protein-like surface antigen
VTGRNRTTATLVRIAVMIALVMAGGAARAKYQPVVVVSDPYIELHTGPGRGYPIFYVAAQGDHITILREQTDWYKVRTPRRKEGWVHVSQMSSTLDLDGQPIEFPQYGMDDFMHRRWQFGLGGGDFDGARAINATLSFSLTPNIRTDLAASQLLGDYSDGVMGTVSIVMVPFPEWRLSPFFGIGTGVIHIEPQTTIVQSKDRTDEIAHVGAGFDFYVSQRFTFNVAYKRHTVFTSQDENKEIDEWTAGFSFFL